MSDLSSGKLYDVVNLLLGMVLFFSPWLFHFAVGGPAQIIGILIAVLSMAALAAFAVWEEWLNLVAGLFLIASPWLFDLQNSDAIRLHLVIGTIVAALAAVELWLASWKRASSGPGDSAASKR